MNESPKEPETCVWKQETADYYVAEWKAEKACGWLVRDLSERTGLSIVEALGFLNWMERFTANRILRENNDIVREHNAIIARALPIQKRMVEQMEAEANDDEEGWKP